uniref:Uncharacterized protein n=1 Tax=Hanusia phi TaxID=3032 RepID=A0A7S0HDS4_9CRYP
MQGRDNRVTAYLLLRLADASWSKKRSQDLATEIAIVLEQEDSAIQIERTYREDAQGSTASCWRIQFSVGRSSNQEKGEANASPDPEFLSNLLLSLVVAVRSKGSEVSSEDKSRFSNVVIHQARGLLDMIQEMPILSCAVNAEMQETKRRSRDRSPTKFSSDEDDVRRKIVDLIIQHQAYEDDTLLILLLQFVGHYGRDDMVLQVLKKCVRDFDLGDNFIEVFEKTFLPFEYVGRALYDLINCVRSKEKGNGHLEAFLNQLHALHAESEEAYPYRKQDDIKKYITKFVEYLSLSNKYDETVSNYLRYAEISRIVQQVSKYGDELCGKEFSDEEKAFEEKISKVFMLLEKYYSDRIEDARSYSRMFLLCLQKLIERWSPSEREDIAAIILLGIELIFESGGESCDEEEVTIMTRDYLSEMGLEDDMIKLACGDITSFFADRRRA